MTLEQYAYIAEIIGVIFLILSLVYVGRQINQNTEMMLAGSRQDLLNADLDVLGNFMDYPQIYDPAKHGSQIKDDSVRIEVLFVKMLRIREFAWLQYSNGVLDKQTFLAYLEPLKFVFNSDTGREFLMSGVFHGDPEFIKYINEYMGLE